MNKCQWCEKELRRGWQSYRSGATFCSDECRTKYHNAKKKVKRDKETALAAIQHIQAMLLKGGELGQEALNAVRHIKIHSEVDFECYCTKCGQDVWILPDKGQKCDFCKSVDSFAFRQKQKG